ncbi:3-keto-5-aminohexanoate cleavage protein [Pseudonocardia sp. NPDC049635]|uniref:3-keto-5-aminohexanoate cleavage protein n=1 Tax=Pseudonocardia sp. NPDC049635 TaxID=3155506 RepID=UPI0033D6C00A
MLVKACVNGNRPPSGHSGPPTSAVDIAVQVAACAAAGAGAAHVHAKDGRGRDTLAAEHVDPLLDLVRGRAPVSRWGSPPGRGSCPTPGTGWRPSGPGPGPPTSPR